MKKAAILGASGLVGSFLIKDLCESPEIESVLSIGRSSLGWKDPKLTEHIGNMLDDDFWQFKAEVDVVFICVGTTKAKTPDQKKYRAIDFGIPLSATHWALRNGARLVSVVSSMGANSKSGNFYLKTKGEMEDAIMGLKIKSHIIRPSMILGPRQEKRFGETVGKGIMNILRPLMPANYKPVEAEDIAKKMLELSLEASDNQLILSSEISV